MKILVCVHDHQQGKTFRCVVANGEEYLEEATRAHFFIQSQQTKEKKNDD